MRGYRRSRLAASIAVSAVLFASLPVPGTAEAANLPDILVVDSELGVNIGHGTLTVLEAPSEATITVVDAPYHEGERTAVVVAVNTVGGPIGDEWRFVFGAPGGQVLDVGTYTNNRAWDPYSTSVPYFSVANASMSCTTGGSFTVDAITWSAGAQPVSFAATFHFFCEGQTEGIHGQVRWQASTPVNTAGVSFSPSSLSFPAALIDTAGPTKTTTLTSIGRTAVTMGSASLEGAGATSFLVTEDTCSGATLTPGATCDITIEPIPRGPGALFATLRIPTNALSGSRALPLATRGMTPTVTTLSATAGEATLPSTVTLTASVSPNPGGGLVDFCMSPTKCSTVTLSTGGTASLTPNTTGSWTFTARFRGFRDFAASTSDPVSVAIRAGTATTLWVNANPGTAGRMVMFVAQVDPVGASRPTGGTLRIQNDTTGVTLATASVTSTLPTAMACARLPVGSSVMSATYSGTDTYGGSSASLTERIELEPEPSEPEPFPSYGNTYGEFPCIDLVVAGGASTVTDPTVSVDFDVVTLGRPIDEYALSNDGVAWSPSTSSVRAWSLVDEAFGGAATDGPKTVHARFRVGDWWSDPVRTSLSLDRGAPTVTWAPDQIARTSITSAGSIPILLAWSGSDAISGVDRYQVQQRTDAGAWTTVTSATVASTLTRSLAPSHTYQFRARATDTAGLVGDWESGASFRVTARQQSSSSITYTGTWTTRTSTSYWGGSTRYATAAGAKATIKFTGRTFAWVSPVGPTRGSARVYVNGVLVKTVSLYATTSGSRRVVWTKTWPTSATRTVTIKVVGTSGRPRVDIDGFAWSF